MINTTCQNCKRTIPSNDTFKVQETICCTDCLEQVVKGKQTGKQQPQIERQTDPTVCFNCKFDNGHQELEKIINLPVCKKCSDYFENRPFPVWIKLSLGIVIALVIFAFVYNFRFINSIYKIKAADKAFLIGDSERAYKLQAAAAELVPEEPGIGLVSSFYEGGYLLSRENYEGAIDIFNKCKSLNPELIDYFIKEALIGKAFNNKDYDAFLEYAMEIHNQYPNIPMHMASVASAYACKYAVTSDNQFKEKSLEYIGKAVQLAGNSEDFKTYEQRIKHRLHTKEIISGKEFSKRYPNGWKEP